MTSRTNLLLSLALALLVFSFHVRLKNEPDYEQITRIADASNRSVEWIGRYPRELDLATLDGGRFKLSEHVGKEVIILNFFATWCGPCRAEMPELQRFHAAHAGQPVRLVGVDAYESPELVRKFASEFKLTFPIVIADKEMLREFGVDSFPTTVVIGPDGTIKLFELTPIVNTDVTLEPLVNASLPIIAANKGMGAPEFLRRSSEDSRPVLVRTGSASSGPKLTGRALEIAKGMDCVCGCPDVLNECTCTTATKMKQKLQKGDFAAKTDAEIKSELNAEFCMKGGM